jgi:hypothetical protein
MLREIKGLGQIKTKLLFQIYNSLIGSVLQYASCVWQIGNKDSMLVVCGKLEIKTI